MMIVLAMVPFLCQSQLEIREVRRLSYENHDNRISLRQLPNKSGVFFQSKMSCDVDGAPNAYHSVDDDLALDVIESAEGRRYGELTAGPIEVAPNPQIIVYDNGKPYIQTSGENSGFFVSSTSLYDPTRLPTDPTKYLDSRTIQYMVLPAGLCPEAKLGDVAAVYDPQSKKVVFAVYGDIGPSSESGEASLATLLRLGLNTADGKSSPGEFRDDLFYVVFPGTSENLSAAESWPHTQVTIDRLGASAFNRWGGIDQVEAILAQSPGCGSIPDDANNGWIYDELALAQQSGWIHTLPIGLPTRLSHSSERLPCAPEIVLACKDALNAIQTRIEDAEKANSHNLNENLAYHLRKFAEIISLFPQAASDEGISPSQMNLKAETLVYRLQTAARTSGPLRP